MISVFSRFCKIVLLCVSAFSAVSPWVVHAEEMTVKPTATTLPAIQLPVPAKTNGAALGPVLASRCSCRAYDGKKLDAQTLSDLLWATAGTNRPDGRRTAPSAYGAQSIELYVVLERGVYSYQAQKNVLAPVLAGNFQRHTGIQDFVEQAPVNLLFVADLTKLPVADKRQLFFLLGVDAGTMSQNASLFCASKGLGTVVRAGIDGPAFDKILGLPSTKRILLAQTIGWPAK